MTDYATDHLQNAIFKATDEELFLLYSAIRTYHDTRKARKKRPTPTNGLLELNSGIAVVRMIETFLP